MTKNDIIKYVVEKYGMSQEKTKKIVNDIFGYVREKVLAGHICKIHCFGTFFPKILGRRSAHNPRTQEKVIAPASCSVSFHPSDKHARKLEEEDEKQDD